MVGVLTPSVLLRLVSVRRPYLRFALGFEGAAAIIDFGCQKSAATVATSSGGLLSSGENGRASTRFAPRTRRSLVGTSCSPLRPECRGWWGSCRSLRENCAGSNVKCRAFASLNRLGDKERLSIGSLLARLLGFLQEGFEVRYVAGRTCTAVVRNTRDSPMNLRMPRSRQETCG